MRLAQVRIAAVCLVSGGVLALGVLGSAQAAQIKSRATASTDTQCQALPVPAPAAPLPSPSPRRSLKHITPPSSTPSPSPSASAAAMAQPKLCVSVQRAQGSITRGHTATYIVWVSTQNAPATDVNVALTAQPTSQKATFTKGCAKGDGTDSCTVSLVKVKHPVVLQAQIAVASRATAVKSVKLTVTASIVTAQKWKAPTVAATTAVTSVPARARKPKLLEPIPLPALPLGPIPDLNGVGSTVIQAGNATQLFPVITPSPVPSATPAVHPRPTRRTTEPVSVSRALPPRSPLLPARLPGLILLALAIVLTITGLSLRRWPGSGKPRG